MKFIYGIVVLFSLFITTNTSAQDQAVRSCFDTFFNQARITKSVETERPIFSSNFDIQGKELWSMTQEVKKVSYLGGVGYCVQIGSSNVYEILSLKKTFKVSGGHQILLKWKATRLSGIAAPYVRMDFYGKDGKILKTILHKFGCETEKWNQITKNISSLAPQGTDKFTFSFFNDPKSKTVIRVEEIQVFDREETTQNSAKEIISYYEDAMIKAGREIKKRKGNPASRIWLNGLGETIEATKKKLAVLKEQDSNSPDFPFHALSSLISAKSIADANSAITQGLAHKDAVLTYSTRPISKTPILPYSISFEGNLSTSEIIKGCAGTTEPASIVLRSGIDMKGVEVSFDDLICKNEVIAKENLDIRTVKCWYQPSNAWYSGHFTRNQRRLVPELLVYDDSLVKVKLNEMRNYLKLQYHSLRDYYVPIDDTEPHPWGSTFWGEEFPVKDSESLEPFDLNAWRNKQLWITVKIPENAKPGLYKTQLVFTRKQEAKKATDKNPKKNVVEIARYELCLNVLPFVLNEARTYYDLNNDFSHSLYFWGYIAENEKAKNRPVISHWNMSKAQFIKQVSSMKAHNVLKPTYIWGPEIVYNEKRFREHLDVLKELGMIKGDLHLGMSGLIGSPSSEEELNNLKKNVAKSLKIAREYGFKNVYYYGTDEARGEALIRQRTAWKAVHQAGGKVQVSGFYGHFEKVGDLLDLCIMAADPMREDSTKWHKKGHKLWNYAHPQTTVENPEIYRRNYGVYLWKANFDGASTYCYMGSQGTLWNAFDQCYTTRDHNFALPTINGVVETLSFEGYREAHDDVKYLTTLRTLCKKVRSRSNKKVSTTVQSAKKWIKNIDPATVDLDNMRSQAIDYILEIQAELDNK